MSQDDRRPILPKRGRSKISPDDGSWSGSFDIKRWLHSKSFIDNLFRAIVAIVIAVGGYFGNERLVALKESVTNQMSQLNTLNCNFAQLRLTNLLIILRQRWLELQ
jgi:hypothetical protein